MLKVDLFGNRIVIIDVGELHIRYLESDFLRGTGYSADVEALIRVIFDKFHTVGLEVRQVDDHWEANATIEIDAWNVVPHKSAGNTLLNALRNLIYDITNKD